MRDIKSELDKEEIKSYSAEQWKLFVKKNITDLSFKMLKQEKLMTISSKMKTGNFPKSYFLLDHKHLT